MATTSYFGGTGNDALQGGAGDDIIDGNEDSSGLDVDTASYASATAGVTVDLAVTTAQNTVGDGTDTVTGIERLIGSNFADSLSGDAFEQHPRWRWWRR